MDKYLNKCLDSIINQTYNNLEIIIINDGSVDNSLKIIKYYQKKDSRIIIINQKNQGLSIARNNGIMKATGKFISFIDSDDSVDYDFIETLYNLLKKSNADIAVVGYYLASKNYCENKYNKEYVMDSLKTIKLFTSCDGKHYLMVWNKLYKRELFDNNLFPKNKLFEDMYTVSKAIIKANKIIVSEKQKYFYLNNRKDSICNKLSNNENDRVDQVNNLFSLVVNNYPKLYEHMIVYKILNYIYVCDKYLLKKDFSNILIRKTNQIIKNNLLLIINSDFSIRRKMQIIIFFINKKLYLNFIKDKY
jgi:glycosyltransferase involved in cell wall biosynthesis